VRLYIEKEDVEDNGKLDSRSWHSEGAWSIAAAKAGELLARKSGVSLTNHQGKWWCG
jgi:hypothetical protein